MSTVVVARKNGGTTLVSQPQRTSAFVVRGVPGLPGPAGERGDPGAGLALNGVLSSPADLPLSAAAGDAYLIAGDLWVFGDTAWTNAGPVQGPQGDPGEEGKGISIAGSVATYAALPSGLGAADAGKGYLVEADGLLYVWSGTSFPANGSGVAFKGDKGEKGEKGDKGDQGIQGIQGNPGPKGDTGYTPPVGSMQMAINPPGAGWIECGQVYAQADWPALAGLVGLRNPPWAVEPIRGVASATGVAVAGSRWLVGASRVNGNAAVAYSDDEGVSWAVESVPGVLGGDGLFVAVAGSRWLVAGASSGGAGAVAYSDDEGVSWALVPVVGMGVVGGVAVAGSRWLVAGDSAGAGAVAYSDDEGVSWALVPVVGMDWVGGIAVAGSRWVVTGDSAGAGAVAYSDDEGVSWALGPVAGMDLIGGIAVAGSRWLVTGTENFGGAAVAWRTRAYNPATEFYVPGLAGVRAPHRSWIKALP